MLYLWVDMCEGTERGLKRPPGAYLYGLFFFFFYSNPINTRTSPGDALSTAPPPQANIAYIKFPSGLPSSFLMRGHTHTHITHLAAELLAEVFLRNAQSL